MQAAGLNIVVTSNTQNAVSGINQVTNSLNNAGNAAASASSSVGTTTAAINRLAPASSAAAAGITNLSRAVNSGQASFAGVSPAAGSATTAVSRFGTGSNRAGQLAMNFGRVLSDLPYGFIAIQNNIDPLIQSLGLSAGLGLAFTIAGSAATILAQKYGGLGNALAALNPFTTAAEKAQIAYNVALEKGAKNGAEEVANLNLLFAATKDLNVPLADRKRIVKELQDQFPQTLKDLTAEKAAAGEADKAYEGLVKQLIALATVKAGTEAIGKLGGQMLTLRMEATKLKEQLKEVQANAQPAAGPVIFGFKDNSATAITALTNLIDANKKAQNELDKQAKFIQSEQLKLIEQFGATAAGVKEIKDPPIKKENVKDIRDASDVLADLNTNLSKTNALFVNSGDTLQQLTANQIKNFETAIKGLIDVGVLPGNEIFDRIKSRLDDLRSITTPVKVTIPINPNFSIPKATSNSVFGQDLLNTYFKPQVDKFTASLNDLIQTSIEGGIGSISEALGNALVTGDFTGVIGGFVSAVAGFMQKLGVSLIATGIGLEAFKESLKNLNGFAAVAAGAALVVAAGAFRAIASGGIGSFATGGTAFGPQLALIGDNPQRKEHILSDNQLQRIADGGGGELIGRFELDGQILSLAVQRADRNRNRIN